MGESILERVLAMLKETEIPAELAYPGQRAPHITRPVAAVHISQADREGITVEVCVLCPAEMGGAACEKEAARVAQALHGQGADCILKGCRYDSAGRAFQASVLARFMGNAAAGWQEPGFRVTLDDVPCPHVRLARAEALEDWKTEYAMGKKLAMGIAGGSVGYRIRLEEQIPIGAEEPEESGGEFCLKIRTAGRTECYQQCRWTHVRREFTTGGLMQSRDGIALGREVTRDEQDAV